MYSTLVTVHSILRWLVIASGFAASVAAFRAVRAPAARRPGLLFVTLIDTQVMVGLVLYLFVSPMTIVAMHHLGAAMSNSVMRFWAIEHPIGMALALSCAHIARAKTRGPSVDETARRRAAIFLAVAVTIVILTTPWPFLPYGRPLL